MRGVWGVLIVALVFVAGCGGDDNPVVSNDREEVIVDTSFTLRAGDSRDYNFRVDTFTQKNVNIEGSFSVGSGNTIQVLLMSEAAFNAWRSTGAVDALYNSGTVASGNINIAMDTTGLYRLVFSNVADATNDKSVTTSVKMSFVLVEE